ncbi:phospholipid-translocating P-type ATPase [Histomonas meleagridis]|nr:phospholipid-translocating P-type ATPase [Histomonas meleagridis]
MEGFDEDSGSFEKFDSDKEEMASRVFTLLPTKKYRSNKVSHQKYTILTLIPLFLYQQFRFFTNFFYLVITLLQFIPALQVGLLFSYVSPLLFVLVISFIKEMCDEVQVMKRDYELNSQKYTLITSEGPTEIKSQDLRVGHIIEVEAGKRVPADLILLKTSEDVGSAFIKTDQLDGETDWKLRRSLGVTQNCANLFDLGNIIFEVEQPQPNIYEFSGRVYYDGSYHPIGIESTVWCDTVVASGKIIGVVTYTSTETRSSLNASPQPIKSNHIEKDMNKYSIILFILLFLLSFISTVINGFSSNFIVLFIRYVILYSYLIPISMRVNLDLAKMVFVLRIKRDKDIEGAILRNSSLAEELGRIHFLFTDKTGTLTQNEMEFKKLQYDNIIADKDTKVSPCPLSFLALSLCHNVSVTEEGFQASSPDEIALVKHVSNIGYKLINRTDDLIEIQLEDGTIERFNVLALLPFSSVWSHMGIVLNNSKYGNLLFIKGSDVSVSKMCPPNEWLDEVVGNLARDGLRTLVFAYKQLNDEELETFLTEFKEASHSIINRSNNILESFQKISKSMELLGVTGVEDKLQEGVPETLEALKAAKIKVWMLTGDKCETAICIALSSRLFSRDCDYKIIHSLSELQSYIDSPYVPPLVIEGKEFQDIEVVPDFFIKVAMRSSAIVINRCSPSQKEKVVKMVMKQNKDLVSCAIGDGGNDVSMIQTASIGIGIVGKEGKQASLAADVSINNFSHLQKMLFWYGSNCYRHSSRLSQVIIHRSILLTIVQAIYSILFNSIPTPVYDDWSMVGFSTVFTSFPVFCLVFDYFVDLNTALSFPETIFFNSSFASNNNTNKRLTVAPPPITSFVNNNNTNNNTNKPLTVAPPPITSFVTNNNTNNNTNKPLTVAPPPITSFVTNNNNTNNNTNKPLTVAPPPITSFVTNNNNTNKPLTVAPPPITSFVNNNNNTNKPLTVAPPPITSFVNNNNNTNNNTNKPLTVAPPPITSFVTNNNNTNNNTNKPLTVAPPPITSFVKNNNNTNNNTNKPLTVAPPPITSFVTNNNTNNNTNKPLTVAPPPITSYVTNNNNTNKTINSSTTTYNIICK